jgi:hypothetical protein
MTISDNEPTPKTSQTFAETIPSWEELMSQPGMLQESTPPFKQLREEAIAATLSDTLTRAITHAEPTSEELSAGAYKEMIEPQCRDAIFAMRKKGYSTFSSGFGSGNLQVVDGVFPQDLAVAKKLMDKGFIVYSPASFGFVAKTPDIVALTKRWNELVDLLPDLTTPPIPVTESLKDFREYISGQMPTLRDVFRASTYPSQFR